MLTTTDILALAPGPVLDAAIHLHVFGQTGFAPAYSTSEIEGAKILERLPLFLSRAEKPKDGLKPWIAGTLASDPSSTAWHTTMIVTGGTMLGVLCRAALLVAIKAPPAPPSEKPAPVPRAARAPVQPTRRPTARRANGAQVTVQDPISAPVAPTAKERPVSPIRQPSIFLNARTKLAPMPKRKPFTMPGDPAK